MNEALRDEVLAERDEVRKIFESAVLADEEIVGAFMTGSVAAGTADQWSDLDYHLHVKGRPWTDEQMKAWMQTASLALSWHYWNQFEKHMMVVGHFTRLDLHTRPRHAQTDLLAWPHLFFGEKDIIKDEDDVLVRSVRAHKPHDTVDAENDYHGYVISLLRVASKLAGGASDVTLSPEYVDLVEAKARTMRRLPMGTALWRESSRHAEADLPPADLGKLSEMAFMGSADEIRSMVTAELTAIANDPNLRQGARLAIDEAIKQLS